MSTPSPRRRIVLRSALVAFIVVFGWIGVLVALQLVSEEPYNFRAEIEESLGAIRDGKASELYWQASPRVRKAITEDTFVERATHLNQSLGEFREILGTDQAVINDKPQGKTGWVRVSLQFARARTTASFSWHWDPAAHGGEGRWRLFGYYVEIPPEMAIDYKKSARAKARSEAPAEVLAMVDAILSDMRDGKVAEVHAAAHETFRETVSFQQFDTRHKVRQREMGSYVRMLDATSHGRDEDSKKAWVTAVLEYTKTQTIGTLDFWKDGDTWKLSRFVIQIPEPTIPRRPTLEDDGVED